MTFPRNGRDLRLAMKPRCGMMWLKDIDASEVAWKGHIHKCRKFSRHASKEHCCECGERRSRKGER